MRSEAYTKERTFNPNNVAYDESQYPKELDSGIEASGILEVMPDGYGFIRCENYMPVRTMCMWLPARSAVSD